MSFLDARWGNGYVIAGNGASANNGAHTITINAHMPPAVPPAIVTEDGAAAMRYTLTLPGDRDPSTSLSRVQSEFQVPSWVVSMTSAKWLRWCFKLPDPWVADNGSGLTLAIISIHDNPAVGVGRVGAFTGFIQDGIFYLRRGSTALGTGGTILSAWPIRPGSWETLVMNVKHAKDSSGFMKIWRNRRRIVDISGAAMTYDDDNGPYPKPGGLYYPNGNPPHITTRTVYDRGMCMSDDAHTYDSFAAACGEAGELPAVIATAGIGVA